MKGNKHLEVLHYTLLSMLALNMKIISDGRSTVKETCHERDMEAPVGELFC